MISTKQRWEYQLPPAARWMALLWIPLPCLLGKYLQCAECLKHSNSATLTLFAWLICRKVGVCACPCFSLLVIRGGGCTALPTLHIWPEARPRALSQHVPDLLLGWPNNGTARLVSQLGKAAKQQLHLERAADAFQWRPRAGVQQH